MNTIKKFFKGEENLGFAFFAYGFVAFYLIRYLLAAPVLVFPELSIDTYRVYLIFVKSISIILSISLLSGIWKCSEKSDTLPRWVSRIIYSLFILIYVFMDAAVIQAYLM